MKILLFSAWSIDDGISRGTIIPLVACMTGHQGIERILLCTPEKRDFPKTDRFGEKCVHIPLTAGGPTIFGKFLDLLRFPFLIKRIAASNEIDLLWCKGAPAGGIGSLVNFLSGTPFAVDSFEPHSDYMLYSGTWSKQDPKFLIQRFLERLTKKRARLLLPASHEYYHQLISEGIAKERMFVFPCVVNLEQFAFRESVRRETRKRLSISHDHIVGIYVGKYGGLYYDDEAFELYGALFNHFGQRFFLLLITEMDHDAIFSKLRKHQLPVDRVFVSKAEHSLVPHYLSAADFGISTIKNFPAMRFCSPLKHGEYWASDLPILSTLKWGDDAEIIRKEGGGILIDVHDLQPEKNFSKLRDLTSRGRTGFCAGLAFKYRNLSFMERALKFVLEMSVTKSLRGD